MPHVKHAGTKLVPSLSSLSTLFCVPFLFYAERCSSALRWRSKGKVVGALKMKEWSVSERRAGWSFGRHNVLFGLSALDWDLMGNIPLAFRQIVNLELEVTASHGSTPATSVLVRKSARHHFETCAKTPPSIQLYSRSAPESL